MRRFARWEADRNPLVLLDRAAGRLPEPLDALRPTPSASKRARGWPSRCSTSRPILPDLAERLCADLARAGRGARLLRPHDLSGGWGAAQAPRRRPRAPPAIPPTCCACSGPSSIGSTPASASTSRRSGRRSPSRSRSARRGWRARATPRPTSRASSTGSSPASGRSGSPGPSGARATSPSGRRARRPALGGPLGPPPTAGPTPATARERPIRLLDPAEEVRVLYVVPEGPPERFVWRAGRPSHHPLRGARADRARMVARPSRHAAARLLEGRGRGRAALLALPRGGGGRPPRRRAALVPARVLRMSARLGRAALRAGQAQPAEARAGRGQRPCRGRPHRLHGGCAPFGCAGAGAGRDRRRPRRCPPMEAKPDRRTRGQAGAGARMAAGPRRAAQGPGVRGPAPRVEAGLRRPTQGWVGPRARAAAARAVAWGSAALPRLHRA